MTRRVPEPLAKPSHIFGTDDLHELTVSPLMSTGSLVLKEHPSSTNNGSEDRRVRQYMRPAVIFLSPFRAVVILLRLELFLELGWVGYCHALPPDAPPPVCHSERPLEFRLTKFQSDTTAKKRRV